MTNQPGASTSGASASKVTGTEIINAIANLALAARAGTLLRVYQREWEWMDKQNNVDPVDADVFNETFHGIEREFDKLSEILAQTGGGLPDPDWDSGEVTLTQEKPGVLLQHDLNSINLLVDLKIKLPQSFVNQLVTRLQLTGVDPNGSGGWSDVMSGSLYGFVLPDPNQIILTRGDREFLQTLLVTSPTEDAMRGSGLTDLIVRALIWRLPGE